MDRMRKLLNEQPARSRTFTVGKLCNNESTSSFLFFRSEQRIMVRLCALITLAFAGCVPQSNPLHNPEQVVSEPRLIGQWKTVEGELKFTYDIRKVDGQEAAYHVAISDDIKKEKVAEILAQVALIDGKHYLSLSNVDNKQIARYATVVVDQWEPTLKVRILNPAWLRKAVESNPTFLQYSGTPKKDFLVTAAQDDLLRFFQKHLDKKEAWLEYVLKKNE